MTRSELRTGLLAVLATSAVMAATPALAQEYVIRLSHGMPAEMDADEHAWAVVFKEYVEAGSQGDIEVRILAANAAGDERQQIEKVQTGINQMVLASEITLPSFFQPSLIWGIPFLFSSSTVAWEVLDGPFGQQFYDAFREATGIRMFEGIESGYRSFFNDDRPIRTPADLVGLKIRTGENPVHIAMVQALGASPTPIAWTEVYTSLQQGVVDGMENPPGLFYSMRFFEHQDYLTVDRHLYSIHFPMINEAFFQSLPEEYQQLVLEGAALAKTIGRSTGFMKEREAIADLQEQGIEVYYPTRAEYEQFRDMGRPPAEAVVRDEIGDEWVDGLLAAIEEVEARLRSVD